MYNDKLQKTLNTVQWYTEWNIFGHKESCDCITNQAVITVYNSCQENVSSVPLMPRLRASKHSYFPYKKDGRCMFPRFTNCSGDCGNTSNFYKFREPKYLNLTLQPLKIFKEKVFRKTLETVKIFKSSKNFQLQILYIIVIQNSNIPHI